MKKINKDIFRGIAGRMPGKPKGVVIHNDGGSMTPEQYIPWLQNRYNVGQSTKGFAHYYINRDTIARVENTYNGAWHTANYVGNMNFIGYEVCESLKVNDSLFILNEDMTLRQAAEDMHYYNLYPDRATVRLHKSFSSTSCPHRSVRLHGDWTACQDYFIAKIKRFMALGKTVEEMLKNEGKAITANPVSKSQAPKPQGIEQFFVKNESGTFYPNTTIEVRDYPSKNGNVVAKYTKGQSVRYDKVYENDGYRWISYVSYSGKRRYIPWRVVGGKVFGIIK